jgi:hypothetical protein
MTRFMDGSHSLHLGPVPDGYLAEVRHRAALAVAARAQNVEDCRALLAMLGLFDADHAQDQLSPST